MREPATVTTPADRVDEPLTVYWIGGSDVAWNEMSLPDAVLADLPSFGDRPIVMRASTVQAVMPLEMRELFDGAVAAGADAIVMSINPVWLHWDGAACLGEPAAPYDFYRCVLTPVSAAVTAQRAQELTALFAAASASGVPVRVHPAPLGGGAGRRVPRTVDRGGRGCPGRVRPRRRERPLRSRIFTRDTAPMHEGVEFSDMLHPTPGGRGTALSDWLANDIADFWRSIPPIARPPPPYLVDSLCRTKCVEAPPTR